MSEPKLDWATADVRDAKLIIKLDADPAPRWSASFETIATLLGRGEWGKVTLKKRKIRVRGVRPGSEDKLRHFLESVVEQANADNRQSLQDADETEAATDSDETAAGDNDPDAQMTKQFRSFAHARGVVDERGEDAPEVPQRTS